jgi:hypothetical protein
LSQHSSENCSGEISVKRQQNLTVELEKQYNFLVEKLDKDDDYTKIIENIFATWKAIKTKHAVLINFSEVQKPTIKDTPYFLKG